MPKNTAKKPSKPDPIFTTHEVARLLQFDASSISTWIDQGKLIAYRTPGGHRRIQRAQLLAFLGEYGMPVPKELRP